MCFREAPVEFVGGDRYRVAKFMTGLLLFAALFAAASYFISVVATNYFSELSGEGRPIPAASAPDLPLLAIDPGHGGEDGGSSSGEVLEKDLNLAVSEDIYYLCALTGVPAKMTRRDDRALYDLYGDLDDYTGRKKAYDLRNRVRFVEEEGAGVYLSIHQNKFSDPAYSGLQVWYSPNAKESETFAKMIQSAAREYLAPENDREVKRATSSIYVLKRAEVPAVLVECGFLSNPGDLANVTDPSYRRRLAGVIFTECAKFIAGKDTSY